MCTYSGTYVGRTTGSYQGLSLKIIFVASAREGWVQLTVLLLHICLKVGIRYVMIQNFRLFVEPLSLKKPRQLQSDFEC